MVGVVPEVEAAVESCSWALTDYGHSLCIQIPDVRSTHISSCTAPAGHHENLLDNACKIYTALRPLSSFRSIGPADHAF